VPEMVKKMMTLFGFDAERTTGALSKKANQPEG